jgi:hypothetical protein
MLFKVFILPLIRYQPVNSGEKCKTVFNIRFTLISILTTLSAIRGKYLSGGS